MILEGWRVNKLCLSWLLFVPNRPLIPNNKDLYCIVYHVILFSIMAELQQKTAFFCTSCLSVMIITWYKDIVRPKETTVHCCSSGFNSHSIMPASSQAAIGSINFCRIMALVDSYTSFLSCLQDNRCWSIFTWRSLEALKSSVFVLCRIKCARAQFNLGTNHLIMLNCPLKTAQRTSMVGFTGTQENSLHTVRSHMACAHMLSPHLHAGGRWLPHGSPTPGHSSLNNLHLPTCQPVNNSDMLLIFCKIMVVILKIKRLRDRVWGF